MLETRSATLKDASLIVAHRHAMFAAMGSGTSESLDEMSRSFEPWLLPRLADGRYRGWITVDGARPVASAGLLILDWPPHALHPSTSERGYILNMFVELDYRRRGIARALVQRCIDEAHRLNIRVTSLHASAEGRPVYESLGFGPSNEMQFIDKSF
ncbi:GNAT family N-acetyltransferase [Occallatibacter riparius]|uniref:GNAT family N-acetyltransferase n=1 Tax=Occallatibacter riparius TaxID=1002689 RepID=A0A9J7BVE6_9BACT|nr:GNAT family N-acetyltransferase [Occallatibacter riparius]UWZ86600.1 GNAT family N-acetyltransferase [Occallatibacter riparius]